MTDEVELQPLYRMVREDYGVDLSFYKPAYLLRRLNIRLRSRRSSLREYLRLLRQDEDEYELLLRTVNVHTSGFFRNPDCYRLLETRVMPALELLAGMPGHRQPQIWSAGCARGEEPYSLGMLALLRPGLADSADRPLIIATDIDEQALEAARRGKYPRRALRQVPVTAICCTRVEGGFAVMDERLRGTVVFRRHDLLREAPPGVFDLVVCRNLLIYLDRQAQERVLSSLAGAVRPGGYLVLGKSEILLGPARRQFIPVSAAARVYLRSSGDQAGAADASGRES